MQTSKNKHEEKIKNRLNLIDMEQHNKASFHKFNFLQKKASPNFNELSDWLNQDEHNQNYERLPRQRNRQAAIQTQRTNFYDPRIQFPEIMNGTRYQSSLLNYEARHKQEHGKRKIELSPIVVKFNAKILGQNLRRSQLNFIKKIKEEPYYNAHHKSLNMLYQKKTRKKYGIIQEDYDQEHSKGNLQKKKSQQQYISKYCSQKQKLLRKDGFKQTKSESLSKNQKLLAIMKMTKRNSPFRTNKKKIKNPQDLVAFRIY